MSKPTISPKAIAVAEKWLRDTALHPSPARTTSLAEMLDAFVAARTQPLVKEIAAWVRDQDPTCESDGELSASYMADEIERRWSPE